MASYEALYGRKCWPSIYWTKMSKARIVGLYLIHEAKEKLKCILEKFKQASDRKEILCGLEKKRNIILRSWIRYF